MSAAAPPALDIDAYLARVGYEGPRAPTLALLRALHLAHARTFAFENLDPFLRRPVRLDTASLEVKLVRGRRGGWCFEQNGLFLQALQALGFRASGLGARVRWNVPDHVTTARGHMVVRVELDEGTHIADVGFGGLTLTAPLRLEPDAEQATPHEPFRLVADGDDFLQQARVAGEWKTTYRFGLAPQLAPDYEVSSFFLCHHPDSPFLSTLMAARPGDGLRHALRNGTLTTHHLDGRTEKTELPDARALREVLEEVFGLDVPAGDDVDERLERLFG